MRKDRKKKGLVIVLLLIAVLVLGVGYAAISSVTLHITGQAAATSDNENFDVKEWQSLYDLKYCSCSDKINIDLLTTFLNDSKALNLQSYFVNNVYFYHANASLVNGYMGLSLHKDKIIEYPIMKELYKMNQIGISYVPIVDDAIKFDFGISEKDSFEVLKYHWGGLTEEKLNYMDEFYKQKI